MEIQFSDASEFIQRSFERHLSYSVMAGCCGEHFTPKNPSRFKELLGVGQTGSWRLRDFVNENISLQRILI